MARQVDRWLAQPGNFRGCWAAPADCRQEAAAWASSLRAGTAAATAAAITVDPGMKDPLAARCRMPPEAHQFSLEVFRHRVPIRSQELVAIVAVSFNCCPIRSFLLDSELCSRQGRGSFVV